MYETYYGFKEKPFSLLPDPEFLYFSEKHRMAFSLLEYSLMHQASFTVISGEIGAGKTTLIRHLLNEMDQSLSVALVSNTHAKFSDLLRWILAAFHLPSDDKDKVGMQQIFQDYLLSEYSQQRRVVLIIDEAQNLGHAALEELRMLSNINSEKDLLLQIILVGQPGLRVLLRDPRLEQFAQRIAVDFHLPSLDLGETRDYIQHRLQIAGGDLALFSENACGAIFHFSDGIPRLINILCDMALVYAYAEQCRLITEQLITEVAQEKIMGGIFPSPRGLANSNQRDKSQLHAGLGKAIK